jgi:hypothetical protein
VTLTRITRPYRGYRFRVSVYGGHQDGAVIDCRTLQWAMVWYRLLTETTGLSGLREQERGGEEGQPSSDQAPPRGRVPNSSHDEQDEGDHQEE